MSKKLCFICLEGEGVFRFPKDTDRCEEWKETLNLSENPPEHVRLCVGHFLPHEIEIRSDGRRVVNSLAIPLKGKFHKNIYL